MLCEFCANKVKGGGGGVSASILLRGEGRVIMGGGGAQTKKSPDFRSSEVGISAISLLGQLTLSGKFMGLHTTTTYTTELIDHIRILSIELDRACNGGSCGGIY